MTPTLYASVSRHGGPDMQARNAAALEAGVSLIRFVSQDKFQSKNELRTELKAQTRSGLYTNLAPPVLDDEYWKKDNGFELADCIEHFLTVADWLPEPMQAFGFHNMPGCPVLKNGVRGRSTAEDWAVVLNKCRVLAPALDSPTWEPNERVLKDAGQWAREYNLQLQPTIYLFNDTQMNIDLAKLAGGMGAKRAVLWNWHGADKVVDRVVPTEQLYDRICAVKEGVEG